MNNIIEEIYRTGIVRDEAGNEYELKANIDKLEGEFIFQLIKANPNIQKTLEIGCGYGLSSLYICQALFGRISAKHFIIDPLEYSLFHGVGIANLRRAGFDQFELIERPSEFALPEITQKEAGTFDLIFIDGWHTFDHVMLDLFYANYLIKVGGYIIMDDCNWPSVAKAVSYVSRYPAYKLIRQCTSQVSIKQALANTVKAMIPPSVASCILPKTLYDKYYIRSVYSSMIALKKVDNDSRNWDWFEPF